MREENAREQIKINEFYNEKHYQYGKYINSSEKINDELKRPKITNEILYMIKTKYSEILDIFDGDLDNFMNYCQNIINDIRAKKENFEFNKFNEDENEKALEENKEITDLSHMIIENMKNKDSSLIKDKNIFNATYETDREPHVRDMMEEYFKKENHDIMVQKKEKKKIVKIIQNREENNENSSNEINKNYLTNDFYKKVKFYFKLVEVIIILHIFVVIHLFMNQVPINVLFYYNDIALSLFDNEDYCLNKYRLVKSASELNDWMIDCYLPM